MLAVVMVVAAALASTVAVEAAQTRLRRERETQLMFVGDQYRRALVSYRAATPAGAAATQFPASLAELLQDPRFPKTVRHLRQLYPDPMTGKADWVLELAQGRITGLHSRSADSPLRHAGFPVEYAAFEKASTYQEWRFRPGDVAAAPSPAAGGVPGAPGVLGVPVVPAAPAAPGAPGSAPTPVGPVLPGGACGAGADCSRAGG